MNTKIIFSVFLLIFSLGWAKAQSGVWVPAGGQFEGFNVVAAEYKNSLYVTGMDYKSGMPKSYIRKFNGVVWSTLIEIEGFNVSISAMTEYKGELYVGGSFNDFGNISGANSLVKWNGNSWSKVGSGLPGSTFPIVRTMMEFNGKLYVGGNLDSISGQMIGNIAIWDGSQWSAGPVCESEPGFYDQVSAMYVFNNQLFVGGNFSKVNASACQNIFRYDGSQIHTLSNGSGQGINGEVTGFEAYKSMLYLYGYFSQVDTSNVKGLALYNGSKIVPLNAYPTDYVNSLISFNNNLYCAGPGFNSGVEFYNGTTWAQAGSQRITGEGVTLVNYRNRLYMFGGFISSDSSPYLFTGSAMLIDSSDACMVLGRVYRDHNKNCLQEDGEEPIQGSVVRLAPIGISVYTDTAGFFRLFLEKGNYAAVAKPVNYHAYSCTDSIPFSFSSIGTITDTLFFGLYVKDSLFDASVNLESSRARPGFALTYYIEVGNYGPATKGGTLTVDLDSRFNFSNSVRNYDRKTGNRLEYDFSALKYGQIVRIVINGTLSNGAVIGDFAKSVAWFTTNGSDANNADNTDTLYTLIRGSFDPNDKLVYPSGDNGYIGTNLQQRLRYTIRFQNTGTDTAINVVVIDSISSLLDMETFSREGSSHDYNLEDLDGRVLKFTFNDIMLPDSNVNQSGSNGFVSFSMMPNSNISLGTIIRNNADIYFDFNDPVRTNTTMTVFNKGASVASNFDKHQGILVYPNPGTGYATVKLGADIKAEIKIFDSRGNLVVSGKTNAGIYQVNLTQYAPGPYLIYAMDETGTVKRTKYLKR